MKKTEKRILAVMLLTVLMTFMLTSCGKDKVTVPDPPVFAINNGSIEVTYPIGDYLYEVYVNGELWEIVEYEHIADIPLNEGDRVALRTSTNTGEYFSELTEEQICEAYLENKKLNVPAAHIDQVGCLHIPKDENVNNYVVRYEDTGEERYVQDGYYIMPGRQFRIKACGDWERGYEDSDYSDVFACSGDFITFSVTSNSLDSAVDNGDGTYTLEAVSNQGIKYKFLIEGTIDQVENGWGAFTKDTRMTSISALHGVFGCEMVVMEGSNLWSMGLDLGYEMDGNDFVQSYDEVDCWQSISGISENEASVLKFYSNYFSINTNNSLDDTPVAIEKWILYFNGIESEFDHCEVHPIFYDALFLPGAPFDKNATDAPLRIYFKNGDLLSESVDYNGGFYETMTLNRVLDASGNEIADTENYYLQEGDMLEVTLEGVLTTTYSLLQEPFDAAENVNEAFPNSFADTTGEMNVIVVPIYWSDQADRATDANREVIYRAMGNVMDENGHVTTYSTDNPQEPSLSEYFAKASYGKLTVNAFVTDWYGFPASYDNVRERAWDVMELENLLSWLKTTYRDMDHSMFDNDKDGLYDEIIFINTGDMSGYDSYVRDGIGGAYRYAFQYGGMETASYVGFMSGVKSHENPYMYNYINLAYGFLYEDMTIGDAGKLKTDTLIHEFGHTLGLADYYDNGEAGISALGGYDMQDASVGDWNVYSKYSAGWIEPVVVNKESFGGEDTVELAIRSSTLTGDAILIPAAGYDYNGTPFDEYILLDLFTPEGLHTYDSAEYDLENSVGVRIYHVSDPLAYRYYDEYVGEVQENKEYGFRVHSNDSGSMWSDEYGFHQIEIISSTGKNKFTSKTGTDRTYKAEDLFTTGDTFSVAEFDEFFYNGKMDYGIDFGYEITVKSITETDGNYVATIVIRCDK